MAYKKQSLQQSWCKLSRFSTRRICSREQRTKQLDWLMTNTDDITSQSHSLFACSREKKIAKWKTGFNQLRDLKRLSIDQVTFTIIIYSFTGYSLRETERDFLDIEELLSILGFSSSQRTRRLTKERNSEQTDSAGEIFCFSFVFFSFPFGKQEFFIF